ncbi:DUF732 domain-containing protein [Phytomonospora sp. NPDC050363]|uniref:DUF732 domain-containing protein n=1 Tax=Phytomonospora sp. NPDC050363 TaxID=3155642 RepID=UPI0033C4B558
MRPARAKTALTLAVATAALTACTFAGDQTPVPEPPAPRNPGPEAQAPAFLLDLAAIDATLASDAEDAVAAAQVLCDHIADDESDDLLLKTAADLYPGVSEPDAELILTAAKDHIC